MLEQIAAIIIAAGAAAVFALLAWTDHYQR